MKQSLFGLTVWVWIVMSLPTMASATDQSAESQKQSNLHGCCGGIGKKWYWKRIVDGEVKQAGHLTPNQGSTVYSVVPLSDGRTIKLAVTLFPVHEQGRYFDPEPGKRYYDGSISGFGRIIAEELEPDETWHFTFQGYDIIDDEGFTHGVSKSIEVRSDLPGHWNEKWTVLAHSGLWMGVNCSGSVDFMVSLGGKQFEELSPEEQQMGWTKIELPKGMGEFLGRNHAAGEVWTIKVDGTEYYGVVGTADPTALPIKKPELTKTID